MKIDSFDYSVKQSIDAPLPIIASAVEPEQDFQEIPEDSEIAPCCLTSILEALETFQDFEPDVRAAVIALRAKELGVSRLHFYAIALYAGLGGRC